MADRPTGLFTQRHRRSGHRVHAMETPSARLRYDIAANCNWCGRYTT